MNLGKEGWINTNTVQTIDSVYDIRNDKQAVLGKGNFGLVLKAKNKKTGAYRAVKVVKRSKIQEPEKLKQEFQILKKLDHPNIISLYETYEDKKYIYFIMDICDGGELFEKITEKGALSENDTKDMFIQLMKAIGYMHHNGICHRDLKPENLLFVNSKNNVQKLVDFGISKSYFNKTNLEETIKMKTRAGSLFYISPEVIEGDYDERCDIWSAGVILYIMQAGYPPFYSDIDQEIIEKINKGNYEMDGPAFETISESAKDQIKNMICHRGQRFSAKQVLQHPWMNTDLTINQNLSDQKIKLNLSGIQNFYRGQRQKRCARSYIASQLSESEIKGLSKLFLSFDKDGDGLLSYEEQMAGLNTLTGNYDELKNLYNAEFEKDQKINYNEFIASTMELNFMQNKEEKLKNAFEVFDRDGDGKINAKELKEVLGKHEGFSNKPDGFWQELIKECDEDGDGEIDYDEFVKMMMGKKLIT